MRKALLSVAGCLAIDLLLITAASVASLIIRDDLDISTARLWLLWPYWCSTLAAGTLSLIITGVDRSIWRHASLPDYLRLAAASLLTVAGALALDFAIERLVSVPRTLPILQVIAITVMLSVARTAARLRHQSRGQAVQLRPMDEEATGETVLLVGLTRLTELYLRSIAEFAAGSISVAGVLCDKKRHWGRSTGGHRVLGRPDELLAVLQTLAVHGVRVDRIVVTIAPEKLTASAREALAKARASRTPELPVSTVADQMFFPSSRPKQPHQHEDGPDQHHFAVPQGELDLIGKRPFWRLKRVLDGLGALVLLVALSPLILIVAALVAIDVGFPVAFWQRRPGLGGKLFCLYKFRTMRAAHDTAGQRRTDAARASWIGRLLRRTRLDELPQLFNILAGQMSFIGPRPLLADELLPGHEARLLIRPGLTGWAQVVGGRDISSFDKTALDLWYLQNASLSLDAWILLKTIPMVVIGERIDRQAIANAWRKLELAGFVRSEAKLEPDYGMAPTASAVRRARAA